jgi:hypothetical protein
MTSTGKSWEEIKQIRSCSVYFIGEAVYVVASSRTIPGFVIDSEPILKIDPDGPPEALGSAVLNALDAFQFDVEPPNPRVRGKSPLLAKTRLRSWKQLERNAQYVMVHLDRNIFVTPTIRDTEHGGYLHQPDLACGCSTDPQDIGRTLLKALALCT